VSRSDIPKIQVAYNIYISGVSKFFGVSIRVEYHAIEAFFIDDDADASCCYAILMCARKLGVKPA